MGLKQIVPKVNQFYNKTCSIFLSGNSKSFDNFFHLCLCQALITVIFLFDH